MAGLGPAIHVFAASTKRRRGWPAFAGHDDTSATVAHLKHGFCAESVMPVRHVS